MGDVPVGTVSAPAAPVVTQTRPQSAVNAAREARMSKMREVSAGIAKMNAAEAAAPPPAQSSKTEKLPSEMHADAEPRPPVVQDETDDAEPEQVAKPVEPEAVKEPEPDANTKKALEAIDKQAKRFREEQAASKREMEQWVTEQRLDIARRDQALKERESKYGDIEKLKAEARRNPIEHLRKFAGIETEDDWEIVGRGAFPFTKAGKSDPRAAEVAQRVQKDSSRDSEISELQKKYDTLVEELQTRDKKLEAQRIVENWTAEATKAIPSDKPTLIGRLHSKSPEKAKNALLMIGAELERTTGETPSHADVIAEFEKRERAELEERGVDVEALLRPSMQTPPAKKPVTLDPALPASGTRPVNGRPTREQKLAAVTAGLKRLENGQP